MNGISLPLSHAAPSANLIENRTENLNCFNGFVQKNMSFSLDREDCGLDGDETRQHFSINEKEGPLMKGCRKGSKRIESSHILLMGEAERESGRAPRQRRILSWARSTYSGSIS